jgi:ABC-2 type transport system permease protein
MFTLAYPIVLMVIGQPDKGAMIGAYASIIGMSLFYTAIGVWASSLTRNQVVAFIIGFFVCFIFFILDRIAEYAPGVLADIVRALSVAAHYDALARGVLDSRDLLYWISGSLLFLGATLSVIRNRRGA